MRAGVGGAVGLTIATAFALASMEARQTPVFRTGTDLATFGVTVHNKRGVPVTDLEIHDFEVLEDGRPQAITVFARGQSDTATALHVGLLFDTSGSMGDDIGLARTAAIRFLNTLRHAEDITLVDFDTEVRVARYGQADYPRLVERIRTRKPDGYTALYDALGLYLDGASGNEGRTVLVLYTDGGDTRSSLGFGELTELVRASHATIHVVGFLEHQSQGQRGEQRQRLQQFAQLTGGQAVFPSSMRDVESAYDQIATQMRAQFSIGYESTNRAADGRWRKVDIRVRREGARVRARQGYFAPYQK